MNLSTIGSAETGAGRHRSDSDMKTGVSNFMSAQLARLRDAFDFSFSRECDCVEYKIHRHLTGEIISRSLVFSINRFSKKIHVSRFYPELFKQQDAKYLSAASFFLLIHHMGQIYDLNRGYGICLQCQTDVFYQFYEKLKDFDLHIRQTSLDSSADITGTYLPSAVDTSMVKKSLSDME